MRLRSLSAVTVFLTGLILMIPVFSHSGPCAEACGPNCQNMNPVCSECDDGWRTCTDGDGQGKLCAVPVSSNPCVYIFVWKGDDCGGFSQGHWEEQCGGPFDDD